MLEEAKGEQEVQAPLRSVLAPLLLMTAVAAFFVLHYLALAAKKEKPLLCRGPTLRL
jgi:hypothetical protein